MYKGLKCVSINYSWVDWKSMLSQPKKVSVLSTKCTMTIFSPRLPPLF
jgi:hypothetical protein